MQLKSCKIMTCNGYGRADVVRNSGKTGMGGRFRYFGVDTGATIPWHWGEAVGARSKDLGDLKGG